MEGNKDRLCFTFAMFLGNCVQSVNAIALEELELNIHHSLSLIEWDFPTSLHVCVFHLLHHLPFYLKRFGPLPVYWMYPFERFNSWVIRRVQNRRYPESTVRETYRLFEWAHFLQRSSGEVPDESVTLTIANSDEEDLNLQHINRNHSLLGPVEFSNLETMFSPEIRHNLTREVVKMDWYMFTNKHGRVVTLTSRNADSRLSCSSYVYLKSIDESVVFGTISFFFQHPISIETYAYVNWFDKASREHESQLLFVHLDSSSNPVVSANELHGPIVTAVDLDEPNKLWVLNCNVL